MGGWKVWFADLVMGDGIEYCLHEYLLALWGVPIGEMLDLERLAEKCRSRGKWTFFVASSPNNVLGEVFFSLFRPFCFSFLFRGRRGGEGEVGGGK